MKRLNCCVLVLMIAAAAVGDETPRAVPVDGEPFAANLTAVDAEWQLGFASAGQKHSMKAADLVSWGTLAEPRRGPLVVTAAGGVLVADVYRAGKERLAADSRLFGQGELPWDALAGVVFELPAGRQNRDLLLDRVARADGNSDRIVLHNGDEVTGLLDRIEEDTVYLETDIGPIEVETHRIAALIFNPSLKRKPAAEGLRAWVGFRDGSRLLATRLVADASSMKVASIAGPTLTTIAPGELVFLQPIGGRVTYLSDVAAAGYKHRPFLSQGWPYKTDRNVTGGMLRAGGRTYLKGLGMHTAAGLTYAIKGPKKRFQAELAVDDSTSGGGSVRYRVYVGDSLKYTSETVRGGDAPVPVTVDVAGAERLHLIVDFAERADELDHANWLNARWVE